MMQETYQNDDFKYIIQDTSHVFFGKELSYAEIMEHTDVPFKFKAIVSAYVSKDVPMEKKLVDHLLSMNAESFTFQVYKQLKMEVKIFFKEEKKGLFGKTKEQFVHKKCSFSDFQEQYKEQVKDGIVMVEDITISKLALMMISI